MTKSLAAALALHALSAVAAPAPDSDGWKLATQSGDISIYQRERKDSALLEFKAVGFMDAEPIAVKRVLDDAEEYPRFMPYVIESKILSRKSDSWIGYQRISPPFVGDRDYTLRVRSETRKTAEGVGYCNRWEAANELGPEEKSGVVRVKMNEGSWLIEPTGGRTRATYWVYCDTGGKVPPMIVNMANKTAIPKLFEAIRKQAKLEKYRRAR